MPKLNIERKIVAFGDLTANSNPRLKYVDWLRVNAGVEVQAPKSEAYTLAVGEAVTAFDGSRATSIDGTTQFSLSASDLEEGRYRLTNTGGTAAAFRTNRSAAVAGVALTLVSNSNGTLSVTAGSGTPFSSAVVGDTVFVPGTSTGDSAGQFNSLNEGFWTVLAKTSTTLTLSRFVGETFTGASEVVTPAANAEFVVFSSGGVQLSDKVRISAGFVASTLGTYAVLAVTPTWVEFVSTTPLAEEAGIIPGATGVSVYKSGKRFVSIEADQPCIVRLNGDTGDSTVISPILAGDPEQVGFFQLFGAVWSLEVENNASVPANVAIITAE